MLALALSRLLFAQPINRLIKAVDFVADARRACKKRLIVVSLDLLGDQA